ncbi:helix-hairpin-helix domain-containing protein [Gillisia sp. M10.2A]|uniref:Helix-hairpin-helix domain-containing protein n=1 Tax=Gillisia lutea TaxID=2909668 RepID=A0ABS9EHN5_9FLAO|nr:helix-hairpin-helix domain-containing protein [Gillisia lutea]MCF4100968.1 helix-hairpin-helix domain-containing protein [Gillisia lutea]
MKNLKSHFVFSRSEQNGIFLLVAIIVLLQLVYFFVDFESGKTTSSLSNASLQKFQSQVDSLKLAAEAKRIPEIYPFNPNYITDYKGYRLGMSVAEIDRLLEYRAHNKWVNSAKDFQMVTGVSDSLLNTIAPFFKFPEWVTRNEVRSGSKQSLLNNSSVSKKDINTATQADLMEIRGVGEVLATRIIKYRSKMGGFIDDIQLKDVYGLNSQVRLELLKNYSVKTPQQIELLDINEASILQLASIPYIDYELAREIVDYRLLHEKISSFEELAKIKDFPSEKIDRIALYLTINKNLKK